MGRTGAKTVDASALRSAARDPGGYDVIFDSAPSDIGSEYHRQRLEAYARARTNRRDIVLTLSHFCAICHHAYDAHSHGYCQGENLAIRAEANECSCERYVPGGGSFTDMNGNITIQSDVPPEGSPAERQVAIRGLLRHELCHEMYTSKETFDAFIPELQKMNSEGKEISAAQLKKIWNILEDGMIEERERYLEPGSYAYIAGLNAVHPRVGKASVLEDEIRVRAPEGYIAEDADGNPLSNIIAILDKEKRIDAPKNYQAEDANGNPLTRLIEEEDPATGKTRRILVIPAGTEISLDGTNPLSKEEGLIDDEISKVLVIAAGTRISPWGEKPISLENQAEAALLAEAVPGFSPGPLHPDVEASLDKCMDHIDLAVRGNTADCIARAFEVHKIMREDGFLRDDYTDEEREMARELAEAMGGMAQSAPEGGEGEGQGGGQGGEGSGGGGPLQPANGMPSGAGSEGGMSKELQDALSGQGGGAGDEQGEEGQDDKSAGGSGKEDGKEGQDGSSSSGQQGSGQDQGQSSASSQNGKDGKEQGKAKTEDFKSQTDSEGRVADSGSSASGPGGGEDFGGHDPNAPLPSKVRDSSGSSGAGLDPEKLKDMLREAEKDLDSYSKNQAANDNAKLRRGELESNQYKLPQGETAVSQGEITRAVRSANNQALPQEQAELHAMGRKLSSRLQRIKRDSIGPKRYQKRGKIDSKRLTKSLNFDERIMERRGRKMNIDLEIDVSIDRSGSVTNDAAANTNQYRMAKMCALAAKQARVPIGIHGWSGSGYGCQHFAYKEAHSDDSLGVDGLFQTGGGGTPTDSGIAFSRARLRRSKARDKVMVVVTDGQANNIDSARKQVQAAEKDGIKVVGLAFGVGKGLSAEAMDATFGKSNWQPIAEYTDAPNIVGSIIEKAARKSTL